MLDNGDIALDDLLIHIIFCGIILYGVKLRLCANMVAFGIQKIALGRADFTDAPVIAAYIILGCELTVFICRIGVDQLLAFVDAVNRTRKGSIALRCAARFHIGLSHSHIEFL